MGGSVIAGLKSTLRQTLARQLSGIFPDLQFFSPTENLKWVNKEFLPLATPTEELLVLPKRNRNSFMDCICHP